MKSNYYSDHRKRKAKVSTIVLPHLAPTISILTPFAENSFKSSLQFENVEEFETHLKSRSEDIRAIISQIQSKSNDAPTDVSEVQSRLAKKLAEEKVTIAELEKTLAEKQQLEESLEEASLRYLVAEKKLDRAKSLTVAKLEKQQSMGIQRPGETAPSKREESSPANGGTPTGDRNPELEEANNKLTAISEKQKEQVRKLEAENASLLSQITEIKIKVGSTPSLYCHFVAHIGIPVFKIHR